MKRVRLKQMRLLWSLFWDPRVPSWLKILALLLPLIYILLPTDISPDAVPLLGYIDDVIVALLALKLFLEMAPRRVKEEHERRMESISVPYKVLDEGKKD